jgi:hypothetical protein
VSLTTTTNLPATVSTERGRYFGPTVRGYEIVKMRGKGRKEGREGDREKNEERSEERRNEERRE